MKVIITGATGFIGRNLAGSFYEDGRQVIATGRSLEVGNELQEKGIDFKPTDILDSGRLTDVFSPADCVVHCAGRSGDWGRYEDFYKANVVGTRNVLKTCIHHGIKKFIFISSPSMYFNGEDRFNISEDDPLPASQASHYAKTKLIAENELLATQQKGCKVIILRPRAVYGPYDNTFLPRILRLSEKRTFPLINNGQALVDITYIENFIDAIRYCLTAQEISWNEIYNISNGNPITIKDWFAQILEIFERPFKPKNVPLPLAGAVAGVMEFLSHLPFGPKQPSMTRFSVGYMAKSMTLSIEKARLQLGYAPRFDNRESFKRYKKWYQSKEAPVRR